MKMEKGTKLGHYKIHSKIGAGGMGEVFLAEDTNLDRKVALKILNERFAAHESNLDRFVKEAKAVSALNHPNILIIHEIGEIGDAHFIVSEFIEGKTLRDVLSSQNLTLPEILDVSVQIAGALCAAHTAHIVHRDIKPENVIIRPDGFVKVLDFGLVKLLGEKNSSLIDLEEETAKQNATAKGVILGTVQYMSPEQARGLAVDERTDVFSFGVVLYEMIAGKTPFAGESLSDTLANLMSLEPQPLARFSSGVPDELQRIAAKTLRKNTEERYQTMRDVLTDLKDLKENLAFEAKKHSSSALPFKENNGEESEAKTAIITEVSSANKPAKTQQNFPSRGRRRNLIFAALLAVLIIGGAVGYFLYWKKNAIVAPSEIKSLAILPLKSLDAGDNYLGLGIADAVIRKVNQTGKLIVRPTSAVRRYLNEDTDALTAARQQNADAVLEGSVQRDGDRLRVSVNLLRTSDGTSLWADNFDMRSTDIFTIQDSVAQQVASRLQLQLDPAQQARLTKPYTSNPIAYEFYVKGVYSFDQRQMESSIGFFKKAIETDPNFALAHAQLANNYAVMAIFGEATNPSWVERAREEVNLATALDPQLAETHLARHLLLWSGYEGFQIEAAIRELLLAQRLNPNIGHADLGNLYQHIGLEDLAVRESRRSFEIDPTSDYVKFQFINMYINAGKYDEWFAAYQKFYPDDFIKEPVEGTRTAEWAWYFLGKNRLDDARKVIEGLAMRKPDDIILPRSQALLFALKGDFRSAEAMIPAIFNKNHLKDLNYHHATYDIACVYALQGKSDEAVKWLRESAAKGFPCYPLFERDRYLDRIRQAPEFIQFMADMKAQNESYRREFL